MAKKSWEEDHKFINGIDHKCCSICKEYLPSTIEYFYKNKCNSVDGLHPYCKTCTIKKSTEFQNNLSIDKKRQYRKKHELKPERLKKAREIKKASVANGYQINWQRANRDKLSHYGKIRANKKHNITELEWEKCKEYFNNECAYCGLSIEKHKEKFQQDLHKEHVDHEGSNGLENCVPACKVCNSSKGDKEMSIWYSSDSIYCENYTEERLLKIKRWISTDYIN